MDHNDIDVTFRNTYKSGSASGGCRHSQNYGGSATGCRQTPPTYSNQQNNMARGAQGVEAIYRACTQLYPDQPNPLQVTSFVKYWLGGPDPLDYISMYSNSGDKTQGIPPHWHYVSLGLSDLHGDTRVHNFRQTPTSSQSQRQDSDETNNSGFGFELTFRLLRDPDESVPPTWPAALMQALARYVFQSENMLCVGDHVSWHCALDGSGASRLHHMLMAEDAQLSNPIQAAFGRVRFVQIVGVCADELLAAQQWTGSGMLALLREEQRTGGEWLITDMRRGESLFELRPELQDRITEGIETDGSDLSGVSAACTWEEIQETSVVEPEIQSPHYHDSNDNRVSYHESAQIKATLEKGLLNTRPVLPPIRSDKVYSDSLPLGCLNMPDSECQSRVFQLEGVHLKFDAESGCLIPLVLKGRLRHGRHFTFRSVLSDTAITLVSVRVAGAFVDEAHPYAVYGGWLQLLFTEDFISTILDDMSDIEHKEITKPHTYSWAERKLKITIVPNEI